MIPNIQIDFIAVASAVVACFFFGFIWFTVLFGKAWAIEMGFDPDDKPEPAAMMKSIAINIFGTFLLVWVFAHNIAVWNPTTWGLAPSEMSDAMNITMAAVWTWLGFFVPVQLSSIAWGKMSWKLFAINSGYHLINLLIIASIITLL